MKSNDLVFTLETLDADITIDSRQVWPIIPDDFSVTWAKPDDEEYFLPQSSKEIIFTGDDAAYLESAGLEVEFTLVAFSTMENPTQDEVKLIGFSFKLTDCTWTITEGVGLSLKVKAKPMSLYDRILGHLDEEVDLFSLEDSPAVEQVWMRRRPILQLYVLNSGVVGNWIDSIHWETPVEDDDFYFTDYIQTGVDPDPNNITDYRLYGFTRLAYLSKVIFRLRTADDSTPSPNPLRLGGTYIGNNIDHIGSVDIVGSYPLSNGFRLDISLSSNLYTYSIIQNSNGYVYWRGTRNVSTFPFTVTLYGQNGGTPTIYLTVSYILTAARLLANRHPVTDSNDRDWGSYSTSQEIPSGSTDTHWGNLRDDDPFWSSKQYKYYIQYFPPSNFLAIDGEKTEEPNSYGLWQPHIYYKPITGYRPYAASGWGDWSIWHKASWSDTKIDETGSDWLPKHAYPLWSVLQVLLRHFGFGDHFLPTDFSQFFGRSDEFNHTNPISGTGMNVFLTPSSNILAGRYDQPAQKAKITLGKVLSMLKRIYQVYWYCDNTRMRLEHRYFFLNGMSYTGDPQTFVDLTALRSLPAGRFWDYGQSDLSVDTKELASKFTYTWPANVSDPFIGFPVEIEREFVDKSIVKDFNIDGVVSDVDMMMADPDSFSKDLFVILDAAYNTKNQRYELPIGSVSSTDTRATWSQQITYYMQNYRLSALYLDYWFRIHCMPADLVKRNGFVTYARSLAKNALQKVSWPSYRLNDYFGIFFEDPLKRLVKTKFGSGVIQEISVFLCSRKVEATLRMLIPGQPAINRDTPLPDPNPEQLDPLPEDTEPIEPEEPDEPEEE